jgi:hypothetical protein
MGRREAGASPRKQGDQANSRADVHCVGTTRPKCRTHTNLDLSGIISVGGQTGATFASQTNLP